MTVENSGTITADGWAIVAEDSTSLNITNSGTIIKHWTKSRRYKRNYKCCNYKHSNRYD